MFIYTFCLYMGGVERVKKCTCMFLVCFNKQLAFQFFTDDDGRMAAETFGYIFYSIFFLAGAAE